MSGALSDGPPPRLPRPRPSPLRRVRRPPVRDLRRHHARAEGARLHRPRAGAAVCPAHRPRAERADAHLPRPLQAPLPRPSATPTTATGAGSRIEQAIERLLVLDGVLMDPSLTWLGTEREKRAYFGGAAGPRPARQRVSALWSSAARHGRPSATSQTSCPSGTPNTGARTCSSTRCTPWTWCTSACSCCATSSCCTRCRSGPSACCCPRPLARHADSFRWATRAALATPLEPYLRTELLWYFELTSRGSVDEWRRHADRMREARRAFRGPKFIALRRLWQAFGETELYGTTSHVLLDQMERDRGRVEVRGGGPRLRLSPVTGGAETARKGGPPRG